MALKLRTRKKFALFFIISIVIDTYGRPIPLPPTRSLRDTYVVDVDNNDDDPFSCLIDCPPVTVYLCVTKLLGEIGELEPNYGDDFSKTAFCDFVYSYIENHVTIPNLPIVPDSVMIQMYGYQRYCWRIEAIREKQGKPQLYEKLKDKNQDIHIVTRDCGVQPPNGVKYVYLFSYPTRNIQRFKDLPLKWLISRCQSVFDLVSRNEARILATVSQSRLQLYHILCFCRQNIALLYHHIVKHQRYITASDAQNFSTEINLEELFTVENPIHSDVLPWLHLNNVWNDRMCIIAKPEFIDRDKPRNFELQFPSNKSSTTKRNSSVNFFLCMNKFDYIPGKQENEYQQTLICSFVFSFLKEKLNLFHVVINPDIVKIQLYAMQRYCDLWERKSFPNQDNSPYQKLQNAFFEVQIHVYKCGIRNKTMVVGEKFLEKDSYNTLNKIPHRIEDMSFDWLVQRCNDVYGLASRNYKKLNGTFGGQEINRIICACRTYIPLMDNHFVLDPRKIKQRSAEAMVNSSTWKDHSLSQQKMLVGDLKPSVVQWLNHRAYPPNKTCEDDPLMLWDSSTPTEPDIQASTTSVPLAGLTEALEDLDPTTESASGVCNKNSDCCRPTAHISPVIGISPAIDSRGDESGSTENSLKTSTTSTTSTAKPTTSETTTTSTERVVTAEDEITTTEASQTFCHCCTVCNDDTEKCSKLAYLEMFDKKNDGNIFDTNISTNENLINYSGNNDSVSTRDRRQAGEEDAGCQFVLNEANTMTRETAIREFVEVARTCGPNGRLSLHMNLEGYFLAVVDPSIPPKVVFIAKLRMFKNKSRFFTIGSTNDPIYEVHGTFDMLFSDVSVQTTSTDENNVLPDGKGYPMMIVLLDAKKGTLTHRKSFKLENVGGQTQPLVVTEYWQNFLKFSIVDALVYGSQIQQDRCTLFETLVPELEGKDYVIRDWEGTGKNLDDYSISRCTDFFGPFQYNRFKLAPLTPNLVNDCKNGVPLPTSYDWNSLAPMISLRLPTEDALPSSSGCSTSQGKRAIGSIAEDDYVNLQLAKKLKIQGTVSQNVIPQPEIGQGMERNRELREVVEHNVQNPPQIVPFDDIVSFSDDDVQIAKHSWVNKMSQNYFLDSNIRKWLKMNHNKENPEQSTFYCAFCDDFYDKGCSYDVCGTWERSKITKKEGVLHAGDQSKWQNNREISRHSQSEEHGRSVQWKIQSETAAWEAQLRSSQTAFGTFASPQEKDSYESTANLLRLVLWETKANVPCNQHKSLHDLMFYVFGVNIGHHYASDKQCAVIRKSMANFIHKEMLKSFKQSNQQISLLIDAAVVGQNHMLFVGIQASEKANSDVYLGWVVELGSDTSAEGQWKAFQTHIEKHDKEFISYLKNYILSLASDGASVYTGKNKSFWTYLKRYLGREIPLFHCISHKIQLCYRKILNFSEDEYNNLRNFLNYLENTMLLLFQFYQPAYYKRFHGLKEFVDAVGGIFTKIRRILETRWVTTEVVAIDALFKMYEYVVQHLDRIFEGKVYVCNPEGKDTDEDGCVVDKTFSDAQRAQAGELASVLKNKMTVLVWKFLKDVTHALMEFSKESQRRGKTLFEVWDQVKSLKRTLTRLKDSELGPSMTVFLESVQCLDSDEEHCSLETYLNDNVEVRFRDVKLQNSDTYVYYELTKPSDKRPKVKKTFAIPKFHEIREFVLSSVISQIDDFFPAEMYEPFNIFQPSNLPMFVAGYENNPAENPQNYEIEKVAKINEALKLQLDPVQLRNDWGDLIMSIACHELFEEMRDDPAYVFWPNAFDTKNLRWTPTTRKFIDGIMSVAVSTAVIESFFSVAAHIGDDSRRDLSMDAMSDLVISRINHRIPVRYTNIYPYAINFHVVDGKPKSDDLTVRGKKEEDDETVLENLKSFKNRREF